jgi:hypothetical protein
MSTPSLFREAKNQIDLLEYLKKVQHHSNVKTDAAAAMLKLHKLCLEIGENFKDAQ